jgi:RNA polymerase sigma-70 factor (ECF subfamily)
MRALETLMRLHNRTLYRTARAILRDDAEAEDAVQEAWLKAYRSLASFRGGSKLSTWLVRIAANEALMRRRGTAKLADAGIAEERTCDDSGPEVHAQRRETARVLEAHIDALPERYREVFVLRGLEEFNVEETAAALGIPDATVRTRYFRARRLLREWVGRDLEPTLKDAFAFAGARCARIARRVLAAIVLAVGLAACSEKPARPAPDGDAVYNDGELRERTLKQGESERMSY